MGWTNTVGGDHGGDDWTISSNTTVSGDHYNIGKVTVTSGVTATLSQGTVFIISAEEVLIDGTIDGVGKGYLGKYSYVDGDGPGGGSYGDATSGGGGGAHGGDGGDGSGTSASKDGGDKYEGATSSWALMGSGGGGTGHMQYKSGNGGGCVRIYADTVTINGAINVDGEDSEFGAGNAGGGGSGGGVYIACNTCTIDPGASITANGGNTGTSSTNTGGVGGGGRIKIAAYGSYTNSGTVQAVKGTTGSTTGAEDGSVEDFDLAVVVGAKSTGQTFKTVGMYKSYISSIKIYVNEVTTADDFTLTIWDSTSKNTNHGSASANITTAGEVTFAFASSVLLDEDTTYYIEITPDGTGDIQIAVDGYSDNLNGMMYFYDYPHRGMDMYLVFTGLGHVSDPVAWNTADTTTKCYIANEMLVGATHRINADGTGYVEYSDDFTTGKYVADKHDVSGETHNEVDDQLEIADGGYIEYYIDCRYPITGVPTLTATIDVTSGTPTIQISDDGTTWYDIDTSIVDDTSTEYELDNVTNLSLKGLSAFYLRFDCAAEGVHSMDIKTFSLRVDFVTIDAEIPLVNTGESNTFTCEVDSASALDFELKIIYRDRKWAG